LKFFSQRKAEPPDPAAVIECSAAPQRSEMILAAINDLFERARAGGKNSSRFCSMFGRLNFPSASTPK